MTLIVETKANIFSLLFLLICHCRLSYAAEIWIGNSMHHVARARSGISACQRQAGAICCRAAALSCVNRYRKFWLWATPQRAYIILGNKQCLFSLHGNGDGGILLWEMTRREAWIISSASTLTHGSTDRLDLAKWAHFHIPKIIRGDFLSGSCPAR